jgi:hypothetical protein
MNKKELSLVSCEQAEKLKKLGFDWECSQIYASETDFHNQTKKGEIYEGVNYKNSYGGDYTAPTVALALKWLRDEKYIFAYIFVDGFKSRREFCWSAHSDRHYGNFGGEGFDSYEAAESALLNELLTILEKDAL